MEQRRGDAERRADPETAERSRHRGRCAAPRVPAREAQDVAAVGDRDRVRVAAPCAARRKSGWGACAHRCRPASVQSSSAYFAERRTCSSRMLFVHAASTAPRVRQLRGHRLKRQTRMRKQLDLPAPVLAQFLGVVGDAHPARVRKHCRRAVARLVVELATDRDDEVGLLHRHGRAPRRRTTRAFRARGRGSPACRDTARRSHRGSARAPPRFPSRRGR